MLVVLIGDVKALDRKWHQIVDLVTCLLEDLKFSMNSVILGFQFYEFCSVYGCRPADVLGHD